MGDPLTYSGFQDRYVTQEQCEMHRKYLDSRMGSTEQDIRDIKTKLETLTTAMALDRETQTKRYLESKDLQTWIYRIAVAILIGVILGRGIDLVTDVMAAI